ncbi:MAG: cytochrome b/b6 domain-containing protein [Alphaproteobacteria bacterium]|nr:cytochrome b/b6 domain-containing protein [Alphaproteobacteria bacterium]
MSEQARLRVWDPFIRIFHWGLLAAFIVAKVTEDEPLAVHVWAGYVIGVLVVARIVWGFTGPKYARFSDFFYPPRTVLSYLRDVLRGRAPRYVGHNPAGGAMIIVLLFCLSATVFTGLANLAETENAGPLAPVFGTAGASAPSGLLVSSAFADDDDDDDYDDDDDDDDDARERERGHHDSAFEEAHDFFAHFTLFLALFHVIGVLVSSFAHRENLIWSMVTGRKRSESGSG